MAERDELVPEDAVMLLRDLDVHHAVTRFDQRHDALVVSGEAVPLGCAVDGRVAGTGETGPFGGQLVGQRLLVPVQAPDANSNGISSTW